MEKAEVHLQIYKSDDKDEMDPDTAGSHGDESLRRSKGDAYISRPAELWDINNITDDADGADREPTNAFFQRRHPHIQSLRLVATLVAPCLCCFLFALIMGTTINSKYFGDAFSGGRHVQADPSDPSDFEANALTTSLATACVASALGLLRFGIKEFLHPRVYGIYSFSIYLILVALMVLNIYDGSITSVTLQGSSHLASQAVTLFGGFFNYEQSPFIYTWYDISSAGDFYNWMRGPFKTVLTAGTLNKHGRSNTNIPTQTESERGAVWKIPMCGIHQVRTNTMPMDKQTLERDIIGRPSKSSNASASNNACARSVTCTYMLSEVDTKVPAFTTGNQNKTARTGFNNSAYHEHYVDNTYSSAFGKDLSAFDYPGSLTGMTYPGGSGQVLSSSTGDASMFYGMWYPSSVDEPESFASSIDDDINFMENERWIDWQTALVTVRCVIWTPSNDLQAYVFYSVEFFNSGKVNPMPPKITVGHFNRSDVKAVSIVLLLGFYFLLEELQDVLIGCRKYFIEAGWLNLIDWFNIIAAMWMEITMYSYLGHKPSPIIENAPVHLWSVSASQDDFKIWTGIMLFCVVFRALKFSKKYPSDVLDRINFFECGCRHSTFPCGHLCALHCICDDVPRHICIRYGFFCRLGCRSLLDIQRTARRHGRRFDDCRSAYSRTDMLYYVRDGYSFCRVYDSDCNHLQFI